MSVPQDNPQFITLFADASYCPQTGAFGWAAWIKHGTPAQTLRLSGGGHIEHSVAAECHALEQALVMLIDNAAINLSRVIVVVESDCVGALNKIRAQGWRSTLTNAGARHVKLKHVKGHRGHRDPRSSVNTWCDRTAREQMQRYRARSDTEQA